MELTFLGTAASAGYPGASCACANCARVRRLGGRDLRRRAAALVDGELLLDLGPDVTAAARAHRVALTGTRWCLVTQEHPDHLDPAYFLARGGDRGVTGAPTLELYATIGALERVVAAIGEDAERRAAGPPDLASPRRPNLVACPVLPGQTFCAGPYRVTAVPAAHAPIPAPLLYAIERDGRALFYAVDTGPLPEAAWATLRAWGGRFDAVVLDHTCGLAGPGAGHLNAAQFGEQVARLRAEGLLAAGCRVFATHLGHHSNPDHATLAAFAAERGYEVAHDGLAVTI